MFARLTQRAQHLMGRFRENLDERERGSSRGRFSCVTPRKQDWSTNGELKRVNHSHVASFPASVFMFTLAPDALL